MQIAIAGVVMSIVRVIVLGCLLALLVQPVHVPTAYGHDELLERGKRVKICKKTGFFVSFLREPLTITGSCDDPDHTAMVELGPTGLLLTGFGDNPPIPLSLTTDMRGTATGFRQFGVDDHDGTFKIVRNQIEFDIHNQFGGSCAGIAKGGSRCIYEVTDSNCPTDVQVTDRMCGPCASPCPDYSSTFTTIYAAGTPVIECSVKMKNVGSGCANCNARSFTPKG